MREPDLEHLHEEGDVDLAESLWCEIEFDKHTASLLEAASIGPVSVPSLEITNTKPSASVPIEHGGPPAPLENLVPSGNPMDLALMLTELTALMKNFCDALSLRSDAPSSDQTPGKPEK